MSKHMNAPAQKCADCGEYMIDSTHPTLCLDCAPPNVRQAVEKHGYRLWAHEDKHDRYDEGD